MAKTPRQIAEQVLPGWTAVRSGKGGGATSKADTQSPGLDVLRRAYDIGPAPATEGLATASGVGGEAEFVLMEPPADQRRIGRKVVVVSRGRAVAVQG